MATSSRPGITLFLRETEQRAQPRLFTVDLSLGLLERLRDDELLDEGEDVAVGIADDLVQLALLVLVETGDLVDTRQLVRQEALRVVEVPVLQDVVFLPRDLEGV